MNERQAQIDPAEFRAVLGRFPTGVTVVTTGKDGANSGAAIGSFFSISLEPPLVGFCVGMNSGSLSAIRDSGHFTVNILSNQQADVSGAFASKLEDKFQGVDHSPGVTGAPRIAGSLAFIDCVLEGELDGGDHAIVVGRVQALEVGDSGTPLVFFQGKYGTFEPAG